MANRVIELPALDEHYEPGSRHALHHLERWLFSSERASAAEQVDPGPAVRLLEAGGERAEAELVGAEILSLLRAGVPAEGIAVVCRSVARSADVIETVFAQYGIRGSAGEPDRVWADPLGRALLALARCALMPERGQRTGPPAIPALAWRAGSRGAGRRPGSPATPRLAASDRGRLGAAGVRARGDHRAAASWRPARRAGSAGPAPACPSPRRLRARAR